MSRNETGQVARRIVGTNQLGYNEARNFVGLPFRRYEVRKQVDIFKLPNWLGYRLLRRNYPFLLNAHCDFGLNRCELMHLFNGLSFGRKPWVVTFETALPRWGWSGVPARLVCCGVRLLAGRACRRLIAMSECAARIQRAFLRKQFPAFADTVEAKMEVMHPSQPPLLKDWEEKPGMEGLIRFVLVGGDFFRKGGMEVLRVFDRVIREGAPVQLDIVSALNFGDYATQTGKQDQVDALAIIQQHGGRILHHHSLPNAEVLRLMKHSHVGLLPTWAETYGYSVLEAQSSGCPVITTDIRALPEFNNDQVGWLISVPQDSSGNGLLATAQQRAEFSACVEAGLERAIRAILLNRDSVCEKGTRSLERIRTHHDPHKAGARLEAIYDSIQPSRN